MNTPYRTLILLIFLFTQLFSQNKTDKVNVNRENPDGKKRISSKTHHKNINEIKLLDGNYTVPLNLKVYQKVILHDYRVKPTYSQEKMSAGMSDDELISFEKNRLTTKKMLAGIYGEDLINVKNILAALGITSEQLVVVAAILKFFLM